jgi:ribosomal protein S18 acetylase RimI-like enzyme
MHLTFHLATTTDADSLIGFSRGAADSKIYFRPADSQGAVKEISENVFYLIKKGDKLVATASYRVLRDRSAYISNVAVDPFYRRQGIARAAMVFLLGKCRKLNRVKLVVHPENEPALRLYSALGFRTESRKENYFGDGEPRLVLVFRPALGLHFSRRSLAEAEPVAP